jgi:hypothetical protein
MQTMSETQFSKSDWRPSKKRASYPRQHAWAGQKVAPPAFLAAAKLNGFGKGKQRRCSQCRGWALRESIACRLHGGASVAAKKRPYIRTPSREERMNFVCEPIT